MRHETGQIRAEILKQKGFARFLWISLLIFTSIFFVFELNQPDVSVQAKDQSNTIDSSASRTSTNIDSFQSKKPVSLLPTKLMGSIVNILYLPMDSSELFFLISGRVFDQLQGPGADPSEPEDDTKNQGFFTITGTVINGSGGNVDTEKDVKLSVYIDGAFSQQMYTPVLLDNTFKFHLVPYHPNWTYQVSYTNQGIEYKSVVLYGRNYSSAGNAEAIVRIYDSTSEIQYLNGKRAHISLEFENPEVIHVVESFLVQNTSSLTILPMDEVTPLLVVRLDENAQTLSFPGEAEGSNLRRVESGIGDWQILPPGIIHQINFEYDVPFEGEKTFWLDLPVSTDSMMILVEDPRTNVTCSGTQLNLQKSDQSGVTEILTSGRLAAGTTITIHCIRKSNSTRLILLFVGILLLVGSLIYIYIKTRQRNYRKSLQNPAAIENTLLDAIIALDDRFKAGDIPSDLYHQKREELVRKLKDLQE